MIGSRPPSDRGVVAAPVLLTSLASAAILDGRGDLEWLRETRGAVLDWGGVYAQQVRLTGPWRVGLSLEGREVRLADLEGSSRRVPGGWEGVHPWGRLEIRQHVAAVADPPGAIRALSFAISEGPGAALTVRSAFVPHLLPVLVEGIRPVAFRIETGPDGLRIRQRGFALALRSSSAPSHLGLNRSSWIGGRFHGRIDEVASDYELLVGPQRPAQLALLLYGGLERDLERPERAAGVVADPTGPARVLDADDRAWTERTPELRFPDAPALERGYRSARAALRRLYSVPGDGLTGLVAGYPWYSALWCRDLAWMLPAVLWLGDFEHAERSIDTVLRFQARSGIAMLGAEAGELPMQITPGPVFFYGTSDTTLYYPMLAARHLRHSADPRPVRSWTPALERIVAWGRARSDPVTGWLRHGGEAEAIASATASVARIRYGIDATDTTIWDSTDRRDHAVDLEVLWIEALRAVADLRPEATGEAASAADRALADRLAAAVPTRYDWPEEAYLYDTLRDGVPAARLRPNALRAVSAGLLGADRARAVVRRAARDDLTTPWGVRTLSSRDPHYDPSAYHDGQVWTIATAWAADAAFAAGEGDLGRAYLGTIAEILDREGGFANECYRGDRPEPFDSCFLLGFSIAPFLTVLFERLWGLTVDAPAQRLGIRPSFPASWTSAAIERLRIGPGRVTIRFTPGALEVDWSGPDDLTVETPAESGPVAAGRSRTFRSV